ncbi:histidine phosphatase family protein [Paenibacillus albiflavus]|uniref:Histidine phosphatase family protein n=1 Tax=Paenibacillus albiflavus TaxID=2545760 RepID=A0A4V2WPQ0_9BACL|nr:histidine phosphatase family protein [Paenibacillus albiflavus]TCZ80202.1 histidine phosphatase family protein [Paenibacillus albiflavus]
MKTYIYMIRHGESPKDGDNERTRGLTDKGMSGAHLVTDILKNEEIDTFISSPYSRAIVTIEGLAQSMGKEIMIYEELKEIVFLNDDKILPEHELYPTVTKMFNDRHYSLPEGESIVDCQARAINVFKQILSIYKGQKIAIGTHGAIMTLIMGYFDSQYDLEFLLKTSKPDIYRMEFDGEQLIEVKRFWKNDC